MFPEDEIDLVVVIRANTTILYDRLKARNYSETKLQQNLDAEIFQELLEEARGAYDGNVVQEMWSDDLGMMDENVERIGGWVEEWMKDHRDDEHEDD